MKIQLLIVDDEQEIREMLSRHFRFLGYDVETAENGKDAVEKMNDRKTDIVISDMMMPEMDGPELCRAIRKNFPMTRVIMITGHVTLTNALTCLRLGADHCIFKPLEDLGELESAVKGSAEVIQRWLGVLKQLVGKNFEKNDSCKESR
ncbi:MAG: response regulator [Bdellovibrionales bacterium]|nr:response regulator [Bdellovibrionales bacterium]